MNPSKPAVSLRISVARQEMELHTGSGELLLRAPVSTSRFGIGTQAGSNRTPTGRFRICEKFGEQAPVGTIFKGRRAVGLYDPARSTDQDLILTRILWLDGLDEGNKNTRGRYIYIHGTNHEEDIGSPASIGCIRLRAEDLIELFDLCLVGTPVEIVAD